MAGSYEELQTLGITDAIALNGPVYAILHKPVVKIPAEENRGNNFPSKMSSELEAAAEFRSVSFVKVI
jgi:hypothetical protein